jgi:hypothetical protein
MRKPPIDGIKVDLRIQNPVKPEDKLVSHNEEERNSTVVYEKNVYQRLDGSRYCLEFIAVSPYFYSPEDAWYLTELG